MLQTDGKNRVVKSLSSNCIRLSLMLLASMGFWTGAVSTAFGQMQQSSSSMTAASASVPPSLRKPITEPEFLVAEVVVSGVDGQLRDEVLRVISTKTRRTTTRSKLQEDSNLVFETGFFASVKAVSEGTPSGVRVIFVVQSNPIFRNIQIKGAQVLPQEIVRDAFKDQYNQVLNVKKLKQGIQKINTWYQSKGYVLAQTLEPQISSDGVVVLTVLEGIIGDIQIRFLDKDGNTTNKQGKPIRGITPISMILAEIKSKSGEVFNRSQLEADLQRVYGIGIAKDVKFSLEPSRQSPQKVTIVINIASELIGEWNDWTRLAASALNASQSKNYDVATKEYQELANLFHAKRLRTKEALTLNNIGNLYQQSEAYRSAFETYSKAKAIFTDLNVPLMEVLMLIKMAQTSSSLGDPQQAVIFYQEALAKMRSLKENTSLDKLLGPVSTELKNDLGDPKGNIQSYVSGFLSMTELAITFELAATYNTLGDYQQSVYLTHDAHLLIASRNLEDAWKNVAKNALSNLSANFPGESQDKKYQRELLKFSPGLARILSKSPEIYQPLMLRFTYFDLGWESKAIKYDKQAQSALRDALETVRASLNEKKDGNSSPYIQLAGSAVSFFLKEQRTDKDTQQLVGQISTTLKSLLEKDESSEINQYISTFGPFLITLFSSNTDDEQMLRFTDQAFSLWDSLNLTTIKPSGSSIDSSINQLVSSKKLDWVKSIIFNMRGEAYFRLGKNREAIKNYRQAIQSTSIDVQVAQKLFQPDSEAAKVLQLFQPILESMQVSWSSSPSQRESVLKSNFEKIQQLLESDPKVSQRFLNLSGGVLNIFSLLIKANSLSSLGKAYTNLGEFENARRAYYQALAIHSIFGNSLQEAEDRYGLAQIEWKLGNFAEARTQIEKAVGILEVSVPSKSTESNNSAYIIANYDYGYGFESKGSISASVGFSTKGIKDNVQLSNRNLPFSVACSTPTEYFSCKQRYFDLYINLLMDMHHHQPSSGYLVSAFEASERARAGTSEVLQGVRAKAFKEAIERGQKVQIDPSYLEQLLLDQPVKLTEIQRSLDEDTLLLEYFLGEKQSYLWVLSKNGLKSFPISGKAEVETKARRFYQSLTSPDGRTSPRTTAEIGRGLSKTILGQEVTRQLGRKRLLIVGDGLLQYIPFSALPNLQPDNKLTLARLNGEFAPYMQPLLVTNEIVNLPSASLLVRIRQRHNNGATPTKELAVFADPVFNHRDKRAESLLTQEGVAVNNLNELRNTVVSPDVEAIYSSLPGTQGEMERITKLVPSGKSDQWSGFKANYENALSLTLNQYRIIHFATHGIFNTRSLERSGIVLSSFNQKGELQRGLLSSSDAFKMHLSAAELVVLSGCRTGLGNEARREALTGLTGSLMAAGAERVMVSLWSVNDETTEATARLMEIFYQKILDHSNPMSPARALREAQLAMWNDARFQAPYNWAAFTMQGDWHEMQSQGNQPVTQATESLKTAR